MFASVDQSLQRLGLDYVDIFYSHCPDPEVPLEETLATLEQIVRQGKALYVGLSNYPRKSLEQAGHGKRLSREAPITVHQVGYNLFQRKAEHDLEEIARATGLGTIACSPLLEGLLSTKYLDSFPEESRATKVWTEKQRAAVTPALKERIRKLNQIAQSRDQTLPQMAIAWILRRREITSVMMGASAIEQIEENVRALDNLKFSADELRLIDQASVE